MSLFSFSSDVLYKISGWFRLPHHFSESVDRCIVTAAFGTPFKYTYLLTYLLTY